MGRKIPGKKHRGVKDPLKQQAKRQAELETKINAPPKDASEQAIPKSLERVVKLKEAVKSGRLTKAKRKRKKNALISVGGGNSTPLHPKARPDKVVPIFRQRPGESEQQFLYRVNRDTQAFINETAFERKFSVQVNRNPETGKIEGLSKCEQSEMEKIEMLRAKHKNIKKKKKKKNTADAPKMSKSEKRKEKLKLKKQKQLEENVDEFDRFKDRVEFGEIVHEPPQLNVRPKNADAISTSKPGKKRLLLHSMLKSGEKLKAVSKESKSISRTGKRKNLPVGERRQLEKQQSDIIVAYRRLKAQRSASANT